MSGTHKHERLRNWCIVAVLFSAHNPSPAWPAARHAAALLVADAEAQEEGLRGYDYSPLGLHAQLEISSEPRDADSTKQRTFAALPVSDSDRPSDALSARSPVLAPLAAVADASGKWQLAPVRVWGDLAYDFRRTSVEGLPGFIRHSAIANVNASTYIYEPWFAIASAGLGLSASRLNDGVLSGGDRFLSAYARLNVFPASRFPFEARFLRSDSGSDTDLGADQTYRLTRYGISQRYRSEDGRDQYSVSFDRFTQDSTSVGKDIQNALQFDANFRLRRDHELQLLGTWNHNQRVSTSERDDYETLVARHAFRPDSTFSLENSFNLTHTDSRFASAASDLRIFQLNSIALWRSQSQPLTANGSVRLFTLETGTGQSSTDATVVNASAGVNYTVNRNLRALAGVSMTQTKSGDQRNQTAAASFGGTYQGDTIELSKFRYDWFMAGTGIQNSGSSDRNGFSFSGTLGNSLSRAFLTGSRGSITFNVAQNVSVITSAQSEGSKQLFHSGSITWNQNEAETNSTSFIRLSATDSRYLDGQRETLQLVNLQLTRTLELSRDRSFSGNLTFQTTRRISQRPGFGATINQGKPESTVSADLNYRHQNLFDVSRLTFTSQLRLNRQELIQVLGTPHERELRSWENRLDYNIGRLETRLLMRIAEIDRTQQWLAMLRVTRRF